LLLVRFTVNPFPPEAASAIVTVPVVFVPPVSTTCGEFGPTPSPNRKLAVVGERIDSTAVFVVAEWIAEIVMLLLPADRSVLIAKVAA